MKTEPDSYERTKLIGVAYALLLADQHCWYIEEEYRVPTYDEVAQTIEELESSAVETGAAETGRLRVDYDKQHKIFTYYFHLGEIY